MNAVIYARYSSAGQRDVSIEDQVREIEAYAKTCNFTIIHTYADRAISGRTDKRPQFRMMINDAKKRQFQAVLVYKYDRFARNQYDAVVNKKSLSDCGVKLIAVKEPIPDGHGAKILESIYQAMAEEYSENLSQNIKRGQKGNALRCVANHKAPFGYIINPNTHKYDIDPENAPYVKAAFDMVLQGKQHKEILAYLEKHGKPHSKNWMYSMLHNERYTGVYIYGDTRVEGGMPQIISEVDFNRVQDVMKKRQQKPQLKPYNYLFSGLIYCGYCGTLMNGESAASHTGTVYRYYCCPAAKKKKQCHKQRISAPFLEAKAVEALKQTIFTDEVIDRLANDVYTYITRNQKESLSYINKRLAEIEKTLANILANVESNPHVPASLISRMCDLEKEKDELNDRLHTEQFTLDANKIQVDDLKDFIRRFDQSDDKSLVNTFVTRLTLYDDYGILEYDASGDNEIRIPLTDDDFVHDNTSLHQTEYGTKFIIKNARFYVRFPLAA